jgi:hypothetical protein
VRLRRVLAGATILALLAAGVAYVAVTRFGATLPTPVGQGCEVSTPSGTVVLNSAQMANAATIAAIGLRRQLPDRAIVVALATAFQESKLTNLSYGDRDSVGLFQQRPSQGWGTPQQIQDPRYAAGRFYSALVKVKGWPEMRVTDAAQRVQRSAFPEAYEKWSDKSTVLAEALAGRASSAVTCSHRGEPARRGFAAVAALGEGLRLDWGEVSATESSSVVGLALTAAGEQRGWQFAHWLVAHSLEQSVERVRFGDQEWTAKQGGWRRVAASAGTDQVFAEVYRL